MKYQMVNEDIVYKEKNNDTDFAFFHDGLCLKVAEGETSDGRKMTAWLHVVGETRIILHTKHDGDITIYNGTFTDYFNTNEEYMEVERCGGLDVIANNWVDLEFIVDGEFLEPSDQDCAFALSEGFEKVKEYLENPEFIKYLENA